MDLKTYLAENELAVSAFAAAIGVAPQSVHRYMAKERLPRPHVMARIQKETDGRVTPNDFFAAEAA